jgi:hypothetical protein
MRPCIFLCLGYRGYLHHGHREESSLAQAGAGLDRLELELELELLGGSAFSPSVSGARCEVRGARVEERRSR